MQEAGGFVQAYCRIIDDHDQPCGSGRLGSRCHEVRSIAEVFKKSRGSFDSILNKTPDVMYAASSSRRIRPRKPSYRVCDSFATRLAVSSPHTVDT